MRTTIIQRICGILFLAATFNLTFTVFRMSFIQSLHSFTFKINLITCNFVLLSRFTCLLLRLVFKKLFLTPTYLKRPINMKNMKYRLLIKHNCVCSSIYCNLCAILGWAIITMNSSYNLDYNKCKWNKTKYYTRFYKKSEIQKFSNAFCNRKIFMQFIASFSI